MDIKFWCHSYLFDRERFRYLLLFLILFSFKFDEQHFVMMANQYDMETKKVDIENMEEGP